LQAVAFPAKLGELLAYSAKIGAEAIMASPRNTSEVFDQEFLPMRAKLLEVAAALDRLDRATGSLGKDPRRTQIQQAIQVLLDGDDDRAERIQLIFSRPYDASWRELIDTNPR
jgi:hypothetical protein